MGKQRTVTGSYSDEFFGDTGPDKFRDAGGGDENAYNPGSKPNTYVSNAKGKNSIDLSRLDTTEREYQRNTDQLTRIGGFSGPVNKR